MKESLFGRIPQTAIVDLDRSMAATKPRKIRVIDESFPEQAAFIRDPARLKALFCTRRSGKSFGEGEYLFDVADENAGVSVLYVGLTRDSAKRIMWKDVLEPLNEQHRIGAKPNLTELTMTLGNRSVIYLLGLDANEKEKRKVFGQKFKLAIIDEAALYAIDLRELVYKVLKPAMIDLDGTICLSGMPSNLKKGLFFDLTAKFDASSPGVTSVDDVAGGARWSVHRWSARENPYIREKWDAELASMKAINPRIEETPVFQQEYLGRWVVDDTKLVYRYARGRNDFDGELPKHGRGRWHHILGCDLGWNDPTSFTVMAYHDHDRVLRVRKSYKRAKMDVTDVALEAKALDAVYHFDEWIIDGANKQAVQEMVNRHDCPWQAADKTGKADFIEILNADLIQGYIVLDPAQCGDLVAELDGLVWDDRAAKREEHPACANHCADGMLYGWRHCYQYLSKMDVKPPAVGSPEWLAQQESEMEAAAEKAEREASEWQSTT